MPKGKIHKDPNGFTVTLDPNFLLDHALYMPDGEQVVRSSMNFAQAVQDIAYAYIKSKGGSEAQCRAATVAFKDGQFVVLFADSIEHLSF